MSHNTRGARLLEIVWVVVQYIKWEIWYALYSRQFTSISRRDR
jgi:hypothetical protein